MLEAEFHGLLRSRAASVLAEDVGRLISQCSAELLAVAQAVEGGKEGDLRAAPGAIRAWCQFLRQRHTEITGFFAQAGKQGKERVNLVKTVTQTFSLCARRFEEAGVRTLLPPEEAEVNVSTYESDIRIALIEILWNVADAFDGCETAPAERKVEIRVAVDPSSQQVVVTVVDNGKGFSDAALAHLFSPPDSLPSQGHQGMGLYIAKRMIEAIGGSISVRPGPSEGATLTLSIPDLAQP
jgi:C4-dicarboxylate-specific signal transduction histidine kinase